MMTDREEYRPSGRFDLLWMIVWFVVFSPLALGGGFLICILDRSVGYLLVAFPLLGGMLASGTAAAAVRFGHCRNRTVAVLTALLAGLLAYLSSQQFDLAYTFGSTHLHRIEALPAYLELRLLTRFETGAPAAWVKPDAPDLAAELSRGADTATQALGPAPALAWVRLLTDAAASCVLPVVIVLLLAPVPYAENLRRWLYGHTVYLDPEDARDFVEFLEDGDREGMAEALEPISHPVLTDVGSFTVYYLPYDPNTPVFAYLSIMKGATSVSTLPNRLLRYVRLTPEEIAVLKDRLKLPGLQAGAPPVVARRARARAGTDAVIDLPDGGRTLTRTNAWIGNILSASPVIVGLVLALAAGIGAWQAYPHLGDLSIGAGVLLGLTALTLGVVLTIQWEAGLGNRFLYRRLVRVIRARPDPIVDPDDPDALYVQVIPRTNWGRVMLENASDAGFLKLDATRRLILFEGDRQRWQIPAAAVTAIAVEEFCIGPMDPQEANVHPMLVLTAEVDGESWEAPLCRPHLEFTRWTTAGRRQAVGELTDLMREFLHPPPGDR